jgi:hypothetical protein
MSQNHAYVFDLAHCLCCSQAEPEPNTELCAECAIAMRYCEPTNTVGPCPVCPPGSWADLYWTTLDERDRLSCLTHAVRKSASIRERRRPDFSHRGDVRNVS